MATAAEKDLKYYLDNPDEMPTDPKEIERLANEQMAKTREVSEEVMNVDKIVGKDENAPAPAVAAEPSPAIEEPAAAEPAAADQPEGILARDGKNIIPYSQLQSARDRAIAAEKLATELAAQLEIARKSGEKPPEQTDRLTNDDLTALEQESPTLAKALRSLQDENARVQGQLTEVVAKLNQQDQVQEAEVKDDVQAAVDDNPTLATWQTSEDQTMWREAAKFDKVLRGNPLYDNVSFADRFAKVVELTESALGLPPTTVDVDETPAQLPTQQPTQQQIKAVAAAKLAQARVKGVPKSLSDIPGGEPPAQDEREKVESMSPVALGQMFQGFKSSDEIQAYLATL
jgi:hypothetical protein